jgi:ABC-type lipoprotein release transport system permease subunit
VLAFGILVSAVGFTLLSSESSTSALRVAGTIARNWRPAYDILVRPRSSFTRLEKERRLVRVNYLSGIFGGISLHQWHEILDVPGVAVAAPIENIGYILPFERTPIVINAFMDDDPVQLYRIRQTRIANSGAAVYQDANLYVYYTTVHRFVDVAGDPREVLGQGMRLNVCGPYNYRRPAVPRAPFNLQARSYLRCFSSWSSRVAKRETGLAAGEVGTVATVYFPLLLSAIDPLQESKLVDLSAALTDGRFLTEGEGLIEVPGIGANGSSVREVPVIAASRTSLDETLHFDIDRLAVPAGVDVPRKLSSRGVTRFITRLQGRTVGEFDPQIQSIYQSLLTEASEPEGLGTFESYRVVTSVSYRELFHGELEPIAVRTDPDVVWRSPLLNFVTPPIENSDVQFRGQTARPAMSALEQGFETKPRLRLVGQYDPGRIRSLGKLAAVPLETYFPPVVTPADGASRAALRGKLLRPTMNIGGYVSAPPQLLTTLEAARVFFDAHEFEGASARAPISVIRVRVQGRAGPDPISRERVRLVAMAIHDRTGLAVDIVAGSSPTQVLVRIPKGNFGEPSLLVSEGWVKKDVAVGIMRGLDRKSVTIFLLVLFVAALFVINATVASVRGRRTEIGTLLALGWKRGDIFLTVLAETALVGLLAGLVGTVVGTAVGRVLSLRLSGGRLLLVVPVAVVMATLAGLVPASLAARATPMDAVSPVAWRDQKGKARTMTGMALVNIRRPWSRTVIAAATVFVGTASTTFLFSVNLAFQGALLGTVLGRFISIQVRAVDYVGVALVTALAALAVADVLMANLRDRSVEIATLLAAGWGREHLRKLVLMEAALIGLLGSVPGAVCGALMGTILGGDAATLTLAGGLAIVIGTGVVMAASLVPAGRAYALTPHTVLREE